MTDVRRPDLDAENAPDRAGNRPRIVVAISYGLSVRYLVPTGILEALQRSADVIVALSWDDDALADELRGIVTDVERLPEAQLSHELRMYRQRLGVLHAYRLKSPTTKLRRYRWNGRRSLRRRVLHQVRLRRDQLATRIPGRASSIEHMETDQFRAGSNQDEFARFLDRVQADAVVSVMPYHDPDSLLLRAARASDLATVAAVISFDNPTIRGRLPVACDRTLVWNHQNSDQLLRSHPDLPPSSVRVIGAPQFDLHRQQRLVIDEDDWRNRLGIPPGRPVILYGAGPHALVPNEAELVRLIDRSIDAGALPGNPFLLVRRHPVDPAEVWMSVATEIRQGAVVDPWAPGSDPMRSWPTTADLELQMSSLAHAVVHVNVCSSMTVDGAMFDRPQIGPRFVPGSTRRQQRVLRDFYRQEHWEPISRSNGLATVDTPEQLVAALRTALVEPARDRAARQALCQSVLTTPDGQASRRFVREVMAVVEQRPPMVSTDHHR